LAQHVKHFRCLQDSINQLENEIAVWLAQTQGAFLTTVRGIGVCIFRLIPATNSAPFRPPIPEHSGHLFRNISATL
ncbi:MAG: hypothetical protein U9Q84_06640, partial [Thermodesulfobacteriota bacterium]|nr:hypothetical protein [Thermodesulfobacteriota bacterium]